MTELTCLEAAKPVKGEKRTTSRERKAGTTMKAHCAFGHGNPPLVIQNPKIL